MNVVVSKNHAADLRCADIAGEVDAHSLLFKTREVLTEGPPVRSDFVVIVSIAIRRDDRVIEWSDGTAFARNFRGDTLIDFGRQTRVDEDGHLGLSEHVDEARGNDPATSVDGALAWVGRQIADGGNLAVTNADIAGVPRRASAVDDVAVGDDDVEFWRLSEQEVREPQRTEGNNAD